MTNTPLPNSSKANKICFWIISFTLFVGLSLSIISWLEICVEHCSSNKDYRLFGVPFAYVGITYFVTLLFSHVLSRIYPLALILTGALLASGIGAEVVFIAIQKFQMGQWCPVCLSIAATLSIATLIFIFSLPVSQTYKKGIFIMDKFKKTLGSFTFFVIGFILAFSGISKVDQLAASVDQIQKRIELGNKESPIEIYYFTDWFCPSCKKVDRRIDAFFPKIQSKVGFYFIDFPVHTKTLNYTPYNLAFLINDKSQYLKARQMIEKMAEEIDSPTDEDIEAHAKKAGLKFKELTYLDVRSGIEFFNKLSEKYKLNSTPTMIIQNTKTGKFKRLEGSDEISEADILKAIEGLDKGSAGSGSSSSK
jgi:thiol-disulfide isomerase/thioredoxin